MDKILVIANSSAGLYHFRMVLLKELLKQNEVVASVPLENYVNQLNKIGLHLINTPMNRRGLNPIEDLKLIKQYKQIIKTEKPDKIITYTIKPNIYASMIAQLYKIPYYVNITGLGTTFQNEGLLKKIIVTLYKLALRNVNCVFFENEENKNIFVQHKIIKEKKAYLLHGAGVDLDLYKFTPYPNEQDNIRFLFIGRVMKEKGIDEFIETAKKIKKEYSNIQFDIVGPMEDNYKEIIETNLDVINYYGYQEDVKPFIQQCHCFVLPSYHEGMANTLLESAAMARPLITSNIHGCKEAVKNNGYLCNPQDSEDLYKQIKTFIELPFEEKKQFGLNSRKHMEEVFDKKKVVEETMKGLKL